jgi:mRNA-degrading endonuclease HigB of HigAB toxin-antitoxin module
VFINVGGPQYRVVIKMKRENCRVFINVKGGHYRVFMNVRTISEETVALRCQVITRNLHR